MQTASPWPLEDRHWTSICGKDYLFTRVAEWNRTGSLLDGGHWLLVGPMGSCLGMCNFRGSLRLNVIGNNGRNALRGTCSFRNVKGSVVFWCSNGDVGVLNNDCSASIYTLGGMLVEEIAFKGYAAGMPSTSVFPGGVVFVTGNGLWVFDSMSRTFTLLVEDQRMQRVSAVGYGGNKGYCVVDEELYMIENSQMQPISPVGQASAINVSPKGELVAVRSIGKLVLVSPTAGSLSVVDELRDEVTSIAFPDERVAVFVCESKLYTVGLGKRATPLQGETLLVVQDQDSVRVIQKTEVMVLTPIHPSVLNILGGLTGKRLSYLMEVQKLWDDRNPDAHKMLKEVAKFGLELVTDICDALPHIWDMSVCKKFYKLAAFAKTKLGTFDHNIAAACVRDIQVLYTLRVNGWAITGGSFPRDDHGRGELITMLSYMQKWSIADKICDFYGLNKAVIAESRAVSQLAGVRGDDIDRVLADIEGCSGVDYMKLAEIPIEKGDKMRIIAKVRDPKARIQYRMKAVVAGLMDAELKHDVFNCMSGDVIVDFVFWRKTVETDFLNIMKDGPPLLIDHYASFKRSVEWRNVKRLAEMNPKYPKRRVYILELLCAYTEGTQGLGYGNDPRYLIEGMKMFEKKNPYLKVLERQKNVVDELMRRDDRRILDSLKKPCRSPRLLMKRALQNGEDKLFSTIASKCEVSDSMQTWVKLEAFLEAGTIDRIVDLAGKRRLPVSHEKLADECMRKGREDAARAFVERMSKKEDRIAWLEKYELS